MNFLPLGLAGLAARGLTSEPQEPPPREDSGSDFSSMLRQPETPRMDTATPRPTTQKKPANTARDTSAQDTESSEEASRPERADAGKQASDTSARDKADRRDREGAASDAPASASDAAASTDVAADESATTESSSDPKADAPWPPAGLGGLDLLLTGAMPAASTPAAAMLVDTTGLAAALPAQPEATALPATMAGAVPVQPGLPGAAAAHLSLTAGATAATTADADTTALAGAALLSAAATGGDTATLADAGGADPLPFSAHLAGVNAPTAARGVDAAVFDGSPTPTPDLHGDDFDDAIGTRLSWLADQKIGHAHIKITPNDLGPVEVRLHLDGDKVNASFTAANADVRQALEQSLPRLRDMLGQHGFQLGNADVGQQAQGQGGQGTAMHGDEVQPGEDAGSVGIPAGTLLRQRGLLDAYA